MELKTRKMKHNNLNLAKILLTWIIILSISIYLIILFFKVCVFLLK